MCHNENQNSNHSFHSKRTRKVSQLVLMPKNLAAPEFLARLCLWSEKSPELRCLLDPQWPLVAARMATSLVDSRDWGISGQ